MKPLSITKRLLLVIVLGCGLIDPSVAEVSKVRIGLQYGLTYLPVVVGQSAGLFDKNAKALGLPGLDVELVRFSGSTAMNEALLSKSVEAGTLGTAGALIAWDKTRGQQQIKTIGSLSSIVYVLFTNRENIKSFKDFTPNDKIAVPAFNSPQAILLRAMTAKEGDKSRADKLMVSLPHPDASASIMSGQAIGGYFATPPFTQMVEKDPKVRAIMKSTAISDGEKLTGAMLTAQQSFVDANPKVAQALLRGLQEADKLIKDDPKQAAEIYLKSEKVQMTTDEVEKILTDGSISYSTAPEGIELFAKFMADQGMLRKMPADWKEVFFSIDGGSKP
ncbi:NitT/TauT family transport system substrate-binding protein [Nitrobacteraceae bacterium AZCC 1564]